MYPTSKAETFDSLALKNWSYEPKSDRVFEEFIYIFNKTSVYSIHVKNSSKVNESLMFWLRMRIDLNMPEIG